MYLFGIMNTIVMFTVCPNIKNIVGSNKQSSASNASFQSTNKRAMLKAAVA
jgi:hypothetical protein